MNQLHSALQQFSAPTTPTTRKIGANPFLDDQMQNFPRLDEFLQTSSPNTSVHDEQQNENGDENEENEEDGPSESFHWSIDDLANLVCKHYDYRGFLIDSHSESS